MKSRTNAQANYELRIMHYELDLSSTLNALMFNTINCVWNILNINRLIEIYYGVLWLKSFTTINENRMRPVFKHDASCFFNGCIRFLYRIR
jgi:hypothetical protein